MIKVTHNPGTLTFGPQCVVCENTFDMPKESDDILHEQIMIELQHDAAMLSLIHTDWNC